MKLFLLLMISLFSFSSYGKLSSIELEQAKSNIKTFTAFFGSSEKKETAFFKIYELSRKERFADVFTSNSSLTKKMLKRASAGDEKAITYSLEISDSIILNSDIKVSSIFELIKNKRMKDIPQSYIMNIASFYRVYKDSSIKMAETLESVYSTRKDIYDAVMESLVSMSNIKTSEAKRCSSICSLKDRFSKWINTGHSSLFFHGVSGTTIKNTTSLMTFYFILQAYDICSEGKSFQAYHDQYLRKTLPKLEQITEDLLAKNEALKNQYQLYFAQYLALYYDLLSEKLKTDKIKLIRDKVRAKLVGFLDVFRDNFTGDFGSLFNSYALSTSVLASKTSSSDGYKQMKKMYASLKRKKKKLEVPYYPVLHNEGKRAATGRNISFYLALYSIEKSSRVKSEMGRNLYAALKNYREHIGALVTHTKRKGTHVGGDGIAPYYFYPSMPYVTLAIKTLLKSSKFSASEKRTLISIREDSVGVMLSLMTKSGVFMGDKWLRKGGYRYSSPLAGMAMISSVNKCSVANN